MYRVDSQQRGRRNTYLKSAAVTDMTHFDLVLVHCADVGLHLYDTSGRQSVFTLFLYTLREIGYKLNKMDAKAVSTTGKAQIQ